MKIPWGAVAIGSAVLLSVVGAVIAFQPEPGWNDPEFYTYELTRTGPPPENSEYRWLVTVESGRVVSAVLDQPTADFDPALYGLPALGALLDYAKSDENVDVTWEEGYPTSVCYRHPDNPEWDVCEGISAITPVSREAARDTWSWQEPASYSVTMRRESMAWGIWSEWRVTVQNGQVTEATWLAETDDKHSSEPPTHGVHALAAPDGASDPYWTTYWRAGDPNPASVCYDDPNSFDEESCIYFSEYEIIP